LSLLAKADNQPLVSLLAKANNQPLVSLLAKANNQPLVSLFLDKFSKIQLAILAVSDIWTVGDTCLGPYTIMKAGIGFTPQNPGVYLFSSTSHL
jgi:hypothetical protein